MEYLGEIDGRRIFYTTTVGDIWKKGLPLDNWSTYIIQNVQGDTSGIIEGCLARNILYVCCAGTYGQKLHIDFDLMIVDNAKYLEAEITTTTHHNFEEGFWFSATVAFHPYKDIHQVVVLECFEQRQKERIIDLIARIKAGYLPSDD